MFSFVAIAILVILLLTTIIFFFQPNIDIMSLSVMNFQFMNLTFSLLSLSLFLLIAIPIISILLRIITFHSKRKHYFLRFSASLIWTIALIIFIISVTSYTNNNINQNTKIKIVEFETSQSDTLFIKKSNFNNKKYSKKIFQLFDLEFYKEKSKVEIIKRPYLEIINSNLPDTKLEINLSTIFEINNSEEITNNNITYNFKKENDTLTLYPYILYKSDDDSYFQKINLKLRVPENKTIIYLNE